LKGPNSIFFFIAVAFFVIGIHQAMVYTVADAYGFFMLSLGLLFLYTYRARKQTKENADIDNSKAKNKNR